MNVITKFFVNNLQITFQSATNEAAKLVNAESASNSIACVENALESTVSKASADENDYFRIRDDPRYAVYFKMLKMVHCLILFSSLEWIRDAHIHLTLS